MDEQEIVNKLYPPIGVICNLMQSTPPPSPISQATIDYYARDRKTYEKAPDKPIVNPLEEAKAKPEDKK